MRGALVEGDGLAEDAKEALLDEGDVVGEGVDVWGGVEGIDEAAVSEAEALEEATGGDGLARDDADHVQDLEGEEGEEDLVLGKEL